MQAARSTAEPGRRVHVGIVLLLLLLVTWRLLVPALRDPDFGLAYDANGGGWSSDFAAILTFAKAFWHGRAGYDVASYLRVTSERFGQPVQHALPFPYSPTMLWLLGPFCLLPTAWSYALWTLLGVAAAWWMTRSKWAIWLAAALFTPAAFACFKLGQTAIFTTAGLLFLMRRDLDVQRLTLSMSPTTSEWPDAIVFWTLTAKPPVALTAALVLIVSRRWRTVALASGLFLFATALLTPLLGVGWVRGYLNLVTHYDLETADPVYVWSLAPKTMGNLRALLHITFGVGDGVASRCSNGLWLLALTCLTIASLRRKPPVQALWGLAVLAYLLLCAHVTSTEELQLVLLIALVAQTKQEVPNVVRWATIGLVLAVLCLPPGIGYQGPLRIPAVFICKVLLAGVVWMRWPHSGARALGFQ